MTINLYRILQTTSGHGLRPEISKALKSLKMNEDSKLSLAGDFSFLDEAGCVVTKAGTFYAATYGDNKVPVTLLLGPDALGMEPASPPSSTFSLCPVTRFIDDSIPTRLISQPGSNKGNFKKSDLLFSRSQAERNVDH